MRKLFEKIGTSPKARFALLFTGGIIFALIGGAYASQVASVIPFGIQAFFSVPLAWPTLIVVALWFAMNWLLLEADTAVFKFGEDSHCIAFARKMKLDAIARDLQKDPSKVASFSVKKVLADLNIGI